MVEGKSSDGCGGERERGGEDHWSSETERVKEGEEGRAGGRVSQEWESVCCARLENCEDEVEEGVDEVEVESDMVSGLDKAKIRDLREIDILNRFVFISTDILTRFCCKIKNVKRTSDRATPSSLIAYDQIGQNEQKQTTKKNKESSRIQTDWPLIMISHTSRGR